MKRAILWAALGLSLAGSVFAADVKLLNVSYDPTRELYQQLNAKFIESYKSQTGDSVSINQSHGGSGKQARAVIDGLEADVVTLGLAYDIDAIVKQGQLINPDWQTRLPNHAAPYTSTIVFVVKKGNPKGLSDWGDLIKPDVKIIVPNPKTSGGARWAYLAGYGWALKHHANDDAKAKEYIAGLFKNVPVLDSGARGATTSFAQRGLGDALLTWENEAHQVLKEFGDDKFEIVIPKESILAEPPVAVVDVNVDAHNTRAAAEAYLKFLYSPEAQEIAAKNFYRPRLDEVAKKYQASFPKLDLFTIDDVFGGWNKAQKTHFDDGGVFDQIYAPK